MQAGLQARLRTGFAPQAATARRGAPRAVFRIPERAPERIVYISSNPAALARNVKDFTQHGWRLAEGTPFDRFPHTFHNECAAPLVWG